MPGKLSEEEKRFNFEVGLRIAAARRAAHLSQRELGAAIGKHTSRIGAYETGAPAPPVVLAKIAVAVRVSLVSLMPNLRNAINSAREPQKLMNFD